MDRMRSTDMISQALQGLSVHRPIFHSEADFQLSLAWQLQLDQPQASIRLERRPIADIPRRLDIALTVEGLRVAIEVKYLVRSLAVPIDGEMFVLQQQGAHDVRRYDVCKDVLRLEQFVDAGVADVGHALVLSNDMGYWSGGRKADPVDSAFRLTEGRTLRGVLAWSGDAGAGTTKGREEELPLRGEYPLHWQDYSDVGVPRGRFRVLHLTVPG